MTRVIGYCRKSPNGARDEGTGLEYQADEIRRYCEREGLELVCVHEDLFQSGKNMNRPALQAALLELPAVDGLVIWKLSRMTRSVRDLFTLLDGPLKGKALHSVSEKLDTSSAMGRFVVSILGSVAQLEREIVSENTKSALRHKMSQGAIIGPAPYGWRKVPGFDGKLTAKEPVPEEQVVIRDVRELIALRNGPSQARIAEMLNERGVPSRGGKPWSRRGVQCILSQPEA